MEPRKVLNPEEIEQLKKDGKLHRAFKFWYCLKNKTSDYVNAIQPLGNSFDNIPDFWNIYSFLKRPDQLPNNSQLLIFQDGIKPMWEDEANKDGGKFFLRVHKPFVNRFWEDLILGFIGEQCDNNDLICGLIVQVRDNEAKIDIWTKDITDNLPIRENIANWIRSSLGLTEKIEIEFRPHPKEEDQKGGAQTGKFTRRGNTGEQQGAEAISKGSLEQMN
eukprot:TRINITY_DN5549_c0_g2_i2.p2 TRINITY_DN5549_c0_g2~~TRINITY_DN5549_c0_g2_i2.p2  ORF type:complete len:219 (+),score=72.83 TRINITY_DN5549_c0_g2_i2:50-706(+)